MAIPNWQIKNFETLVRAAKSGNLALLECAPASDPTGGTPVYVLVAVSLDNDGMTELTPMAKMFDDDPYREVVPPSMSSVQS